MIRAITEGKIKKGNIGIAPTCDRPVPPQGCDINRGMINQIRLGFDPGTLMSQHELYYPFKVGGISLKICLLYKQYHLTNQHHKDLFKKLCIQMEQGSCYQDIQQFQNWMYAIGLRVDQQWCMRVWDYVNPNIRRSIQLVYDKQVVIEHIELVV